MSKVVDYYTTKQGENPGDAADECLREAVLRPLGEAFLKVFQDATDLQNAVHSTSMRVKDPVRLAAKIARKMTKQRPFENLCDGPPTMDNGIETGGGVTDLLGLRLLTVYRSKWDAIDNFITVNLKGNLEAVLRSGKSHIEIENLEVAEVTMWVPDKLYAKWEKEDLKEEALESYLGSGSLTKALLAGGKYQTRSAEMGYTSLHYIVKLCLSPRYPIVQRGSKHCYMEIQVRTLIEEAWGELQHKRAYAEEADPRLIGELERLKDIVNVANDAIGAIERVLRPGRVSFRTLMRMAFSSKKVWVASQSLAYTAGRLEEEVDAMKEAKENDQRTDKRGPFDGWLRSNAEYHYYVPNDEENTRGQENAKKMRELINKVISEQLYCASHVKCEEGEADSVAERVKFFRANLMRFENWNSDILFVQEAVIGTPKPKPKGKAEEPADWLWDMLIFAGSRELGTGKELSRRGAYDRVGYLRSGVKDGKDADEGMGEDGMVARRRDWFRKMKVEEETQELKSGGSDEWVNVGQAS